jgi:membrane protease YdiL (CAAX protease family)
LYEPEKTKPGVIMITKPLILAVFLVLAATSHAGQCGFCLAWEKEIEHQSVQATDLDGDGLSEILFFTYASKGEKDYLFTALNIFGEIIWQTWVDEESESIYFEDVNNDGLKEIFFTQDIDPFDQELGIRRMRITCMDSAGKLLWSHEFHAHLGPFEMFRRYEYFFSDVNHDGCKEILVANYIFDRKGLTVHEYEKDFSVIDVLDIDGDGQEELVLKKASHDFYRTLSGYRFIYKIIELDGTVIWEKEFLEPSFLRILDINDEKRLFLLHLDSVSEITLDDTVKWNVAFDLNPRGLLMEPEIFARDINCDTHTEYVIIAMDSPREYGKSYVYVYDDELNVLWDYKDPVFWADVYDLDHDGHYEVLTRNRYYDRPPFYRVFDDKGDEKWNIVFETSAFGPDVIDIDADGDLEVVFHVTPPRERKKSDDLSLKEALERLKTLISDIGGTWSEYLYVFNSEGILEAQFEVPGSANSKFGDFDSDGDLDLLCYSDLFGKKMVLCANTTYQGALDEMCTEENMLRKVDLGEKWFKRNVYIHARLWFEYEKVKYILDNTYLLYTQYRTEFSILLAIGALCCFGGAFLVIRILRKSESLWEVQWGAKKAVLYLVFSVMVPPVALLYFIYKILKSPPDYRKVLGFVRPTRAQALISAGAGTLLFLGCYAMLILLALYRIPLPSNSTNEYLVKNYLTVAAFLWLVSAPIVEEIVFSGHLYPILRNKMGVKLGILLISLLFSVLHLNPTIIPVYFLGTVPKLYAYERTHCIYIPMTIHFFYNFIVLMLSSLM